MSLPSWKSYLRSILFSPFRCFTSSCYFLFSTFFLSSKEYHESIISSFFFGTLLPSFFFFFFFFVFSLPISPQGTPISLSPKRLLSLHLPRDSPFSKKSMLFYFPRNHAFLLSKKPHVSSLLKKPHASSLPKSFYFTIVCYLVLFFCFF